MRILIDTSVLIDVERGRLSLAALAARHGGDDVAISAVTASELPVLAFDLDEARTIC